MRLVDLPPELLNIILEGAHASEIARLWLCGCKTMNMKLGDGAAARNFDLTFNPGLKVCFPSIVQALPHLESLRLAFDLPLHHDTKSRLSLPILGFSWWRLPKSLHRFELEVPGPAFFKIPLSTPKFEAMDSMHIRMHDWSYYNTSAVCKAKPFLLPTFRPFFPNLTSLTFTTRKTLCIIPIGHLPRTLTSFTAAVHQVLYSEGGWPQGMNNINVSVRDFGAELVLLPSNLEHLTIEWMSFSSRPSAANVIEHLSGLHRLQTLSVPFMGLEPEHIASLPRSLTNLDLKHFTQSSSDQNFVLSVVKALPPFLTSLNCYFWDQASSTRDIASFLPRHLAISPKQFLVVEDEDTLTRLPPGISSIMFKGLNRFPGSFYTSQTNKDTLKELVLANSPTIADVEAIPESVLMLEISGVNFLQPEHISRLPPRLTTLFRDIPDYRDYPEDPEMFAKEFSVLPRSLKSLQIRRLRHNNTAGIICQDMSSSSLPRSLTTLLLTTVTRLEANWMRGLPQTLTEMTIDSTEWSREHSESLKSSLPRLLSLKLLISFAYMRKQRQPFCDLLNMLPPSLTSFILDSNQGREKSDEETFPRHLPPGLRHLSLPFSMGICPEMAHRLPKTLVSLYLEGSSQENWLLHKFFRRS